MAKFRRFHLTITAGLFLVAGIFYVAGIGTGAVIFSVLGVMVEVVAWISMLGNSPRQSKILPEEKSS